jgi:hypothetical protein
LVRREDKGGKIGLSLYQNVSSNVGVGVSVEQKGADLALGLAGSFTPDKDTSLRGKVDFSPACDVTKDAFCLLDWNSASRCV